MPKKHPIASAARIPTIWLHLSTAQTYDATAGDIGSLPKVIGGQPVTYLWKDLIRSGEWSNPVAGSVPVDEDRIENWVDTFDAMALNGCKVPIVDDHSERAKDQNGWIVRMREKGDVLQGLMQLIGPEAAKKAAANDVSVGIAKNGMQDGGGNTYNDAIRHVALTPNPTVNGLGQPVQAASSASRSAAGDVFTLSAANTQTKETPMADHMLPCSEATLKGFHKMVPGLDKAPPEEKLARLHQHLQTMAMNDAEDAGIDPATTTMSAAEITDKAVEARKATKAEAAKATSLTAELSTAKTEIQALSAKLPKVLDDEAAEALCEGVRTQLDLAVAKGAIDKATSDILFSMTARGGNTLNTFTLSRASNPAGNQSLALGIAKALQGNKPASLGEQSGLQTLARIMPGDEGAAGRQSITDQMVKLANNGK